MPEVPSILQLMLVTAAAFVFAAGVGASALRIKKDLVSMALTAGGVVVCLLAQMLHSVQRHDWLPLQDNFDSLVWLAILLASATLYLQARRTLGRIEWFVLPVVILLLAFAAIYGSARPHAYTNSLWGLTHRIGVYLSPLLFAIAAGAGVMYLVLRGKLRSKHHAPVDSSFGSLEKFERLNYAAVTVGFVLLTIGIIAGFALHPSTLGERWYLQPKMLLSIGAYVLYAIIVHSPINPAIRGKRTAILSIAGFALLLGVIVTVQQMK